ncbi:acetyl-CoA C-acetyltransferase [Thermonema lapsum]|uniref:Acetyl-CoA C-acetyltransferase n=1 Tax=Thermonema lapsum TaxID=28195 RepID=A0A846MMY4_9BACT|nr:acetyl-CoA C-acyltransferase [Thermonema lapsum]NIK72864.1 acetyl-CoA C-acetyltransferase [Thermonema lapsum]
MGKEVYIVSAVRTPLGSFGGSLSSLSATELGAIAIKGAVEKAGIAFDSVEEVFMGNVVSANLGQAPARQAALYAGLSKATPCTTINKVCASGAKAIVFAAQSIMTGNADIVVAGGMESMSNIPYYVPKARFGYKYGHAELIDGLAKDGLEDAYDKGAMGCYGDATAKKYGISREEQDEYAIRSYKLAAEATEKGYFKNEIVPVEVKSHKGSVVVEEDEEYKKVIFEKIPSLRPAFTPDGTVTAANASTINDGAAALVLMSKEKAEELGVKPIAKVVAYADAAQEPQWFTTAPVAAANKALQRAGLSKDDIEYFEVNEAFAVVALAFSKLMEVPIDKMNIFGGAVSIGHPLGCSGARIMTTLLNVLQQKNAKYGQIAICNGGGGATSIIVERV